MKKLALATIIGAAFAAPAQAVTVMAEDGWTLGVSGSVNQFLTYTEDNTAGGNDTANIRDGLLPAFLSFDMKAPTMNGLDIAAHISISPSTNGSSYVDNTGSTGGFEQREVYFTVDGSFGQILAGKALGLYGSHNILTDQTLFGVGYGAGGAGEGATTLGSIGIGYDYAAWRSQVKWTSKDMNGFKLAIAIADADTGSTTLAGGLPTGSLATGGADSDSFRYEADLSYAGSFDGGSFTAWLSGMTQDEDNSGNNDLSAYTVGGTLKVGGFEAMAQYSDASDQDATGPETEWNQYLVQAGYRFAGTTLVSAQYSELTDDTAGVASNADNIDKWTLGVYHDVNSNLKLVAEYSQVESDSAVPTVVDQDIFSVGGFVFF
jgi:predicted porin